MRLIRNYFLKEFFVNFFFAFFIITFFMGLGNLMILPDMIMRKGLDIFSALQIFLLRMPYLLIYSIPIASLLGVLLSVGRMSADNEIISLKVAGVSFYRVLTIFMIIASLLSLSLVILNDTLISRAHFQSRKLLQELTEKNPLAFVEPGSVMQFREYQLFAQDVEANTLKKVFINESKEDASNIIYAESGDFIVDDGLLKISLKDGFIEGPSMKYRIHFKNHFMHLPLENKKASATKKPKDMGIKEIAAEIKALRKDGKNPLPFVVEFHRKLSLSFSPLAFMLLGFGVAGVVRHREKTINIGVSIMSAMLYYFLSETVCKTLAFRLVVPVFLAIWLPNIIFFAIGACLSYKICAS